MLISCPYCGPRDVSEFTYQGDGNRIRPNLMSQDIEAWNAYVYDRVNVAGDQNEIWQHSGGCRSHLRVQRNTLTHQIASVSYVRGDQTSSEKTVKPVAKPAAKAKTPASKPKPKTAAKRSAT